MRFASIILAVFFVLSLSEAALAQVPTSFCPAVEEKDCVILLVQGASEGIVLYSSEGGAGSSVQVLEAPASMQASEELVELDLTEHIGSVIMLSGNVQDEIYGAEILDVGEPLTTALALMLYFGISGSEVAATAQ